MADQKGIKTQITPLAAAASSRPRIGEILLGHGHITDSELQRALELRNAPGETRRLGEVLQGMSLTEQQLAEGLSRQFGIPMLTEEMIPEHMPLERVSFEFLRRNSVLPVSVEGSTLTVAVSDPTDSACIESLRASYDLGIRTLMSTRTAIADALQRLQSSQETVMQKLLEDVDEKDMSMEVDGEVSHLKDLAQEKGIISLVNHVIERATLERASDIHVEPSETSVRIRYRIDGILYERETLPIKMQAALSSRIKLLSNMNIAERRLPQDGRMRGRFGGRELDMRVSTLPTIYGESIVMRLLDKDAKTITLEDLGYDEMLLGKYAEMIKKPYGMILITGPTGAGKTTTLYASLEKINSSEKKIITIEEPVEYILKGINQIQVRTKIGLTFANGLRSIVRQDPDVIMVGEIRDLETASISIHASLTGHLLFSTLHTNDAASAIARLIDMGVEHYLVSSTLIGVVAQRLVRRLCPNCRSEHPVPEDLTAVLGEGVKTVWRGEGCDNCMHTGYKGRVGIFEILMVDAEIKELIMAKANASEIKNEAVKLGMRTLREDGLEKIRSGLTTVDEVMRVTYA